MARADVIGRLAQYHGCHPSVMSVVWDEVVAAFREAMAEFGVADHPCSCCPPADCQRCALEPHIRARAFRLLGIQEA